MTRSPEVSVVIAVYNGERWVGDAVASVRGQTYRDLECIVVDDGSTDGTPGVLNELASVEERLIVIRQANAGVSAARNAALRRAAGRYIAFLDADDVWLPNKLAVQLALFAARPELGMVYSGYAIVDEDLRERVSVRPDPVHPGLLPWLLLEGSGIGLAFTGVVRRDVVEVVGGFDATLSTSADLEFACRVAAAYSVDAAPETLALYRNHAGQMHLNLDAFEADMTAIYERRFGGNNPGSPELLDRGMANLGTRLFYGHLASGDFGMALVAWRRYVRRRPSSILRLPVGALLRRSGRRMDAMVRRLRGRQVRPPQYPPVV